MTNTKARVLKRQAEDKAFIDAVMSMYDDNQTKDRYDAPYQIYLSELGEDDFKLTYDEWLGGDV
jgi:hypothetical protein|tara:strand:- start:41 stop:232 length:192 start_codon:yes stop_codon:yes gene_type:complete